MHRHKLSYPKNAGSNTTSILNLNFRDQSSSPSSLPSLPLLQIHLRFPHSSFLKQVLVPLPPHFVSEETVSRTHIRRPLQHLFRPYPKPTLHPHLYPRLRLHNPYYAIKLMFDISTNLMLHRLYKPIFWHCYNKLRHYLTSVNIPRWIPYRLCRLSPCLRTTSTSSYRTLRQLTFQLRFSVLSHMYNTRQLSRRQRLDVIIKTN